MNFKIKSDFAPSGDQPPAICELVDGLNAGKRDQILMGVTGSGKTFTIANVIEKVNRPTLVIAHNKTLAAQLCSEFREFFPDNAVEYFVSYYDYYQPEAYLPARDMYIEKEADINDEIEKLRHRATQALLSRRDVIIVASVSAIYGLGTPEDYASGIINLEKGKEYKRKDLLYRLEKNRYVRNDVEVKRGLYRIRGDVIDIFPSWDENLIRLDFFGDEIENIYIVNPVSGEVLNSIEKIDLFPATHYVVSSELDKAIEAIYLELEHWLPELKNQGKELEAKRLEQRTKYDIEMIGEIGYCKGIENYSRHIAGRAAGSAPGVLIDFFPKDFLTIIDESHVTIGQIRGMYHGDRARKQNLIEYGFRLPSAADNRPLTFKEFEEHIGQIIYTTATPGDYELAKCKKSDKRELEDITWEDYNLVEQIIRPTGLIDPEVVIKPTKDQIDDLLIEIDKCIQRKERVLITALTKRMSENITDFLAEKGLKVQYLHSEIDALDRIDILHDLRSGKYDVLVGVNLLREGLDLPEVSLVVIFDADKEGFLRNARSLIQTMGRAARNVNGRVVLYADKRTKSIEKAVAETTRRRKIQLEYNEKNNIIPKTISKKLVDIREKEREKVLKIVKGTEKIRPEEIKKLISKLEREMKIAAKNLDFELAAEIRDRIMEMSKLRSK
ncbi:excinuclease ABC subunit UvrB [Candidatus Margulisiibacteriota bacterium]